MTKIFPKVNHQPVHRRFHRHVVITYPISLWERFYSFVLGPVVFVAGLFILLKLFSNSTISLDDITPLPLGLIFSALLATSLRLLVAFILSIVTAIPLALLATRSRFTEKIFLPAFDILESIPILAFFPILIVFFVSIGFLNGAALFILYLSMLWNIVFTLIGGLKIIPKDIKEVAVIFGLSKVQTFFKVILPSIVPQLVTGSLLAVAQGWNIIIVAEVLHVYIPNGTAAQDLFGVGSILVNAAAKGQNDLFIFALLSMVLVIALLNFFVWQKLLRYAERFKFD